jgi:hypothetical protein
MQRGNLRNRRIVHLCKRDDQNWPKNRGLSLSQWYHIICPIGWLFTLSSLFGNCTRRPHFLATLSHREGFALILAKKIIGLFFGRIFHELIWSPWPQLARLDYPHPLHSLKNLVVNNLDSLSAGTMYTYFELALLYKGNRLFLTRHSPSLYFLDFYAWMPWRSVKRIRP